MYKVFWDFGSLDCRDPKLQARLGMSLDQIISYEDDDLHDMLCSLYKLPTTTQKKFKKSVRGFRPHCFVKIQ